MLCDTVLCPLCCSKSTFWEYSVWHSIWMCVCMGSRAWTVSGQSTVLRLVDELNSTAMSKDHEQGSVVCILCFGCVPHRNKTFFDLFIHRLSRHSIHHRFVDGLELWLWIYIVGHGLTVHSLSPFSKSVQIQLQLIHYKWVCPTMMNVICISFTRRIPCNLCRVPVVCHCEMSQHSIPYEIYTPFWFQNLNHILPFSISPYFVFSDIRTDILGAVYVDNFGLCYHCALVWYVFPSVICMVIGAYYHISPFPLDPVPGWLIRARYVFDKFGKIPFFPCKFQGILMMEQLICIQGHWRYVSWLYLSHFLDDES